MNLKNRDFLMFIVQIGENFAKQRINQQKKFCRKIARKIFNSQAKVLEMERFQQLNFVQNGGFCAKKFNVKWNEIHSMSKVLSSQ